MKYILYLLFSIVLFAQCSNSKSKAEKEAERLKDEEISNLKNGLIFHEVDDKAIVYVNNKLVYESDWLAGQADLNIVVDLNPYIKSPRDVVRVVLVNKECKDCDANWIVFIYELYKNGEPEDFVHEDAPAMTNFGEVWEMEYVWGEV